MGVEIFVIKIEDHVTALRSLSTYNRGSEDYF